MLPFQAVLKEAREQQTLLGIPDTLKFHGGWKKWKLSVSDSIHTFQSKDQALDAAAWFQVTECHLQQKQFKTLADEVKTVGQKAPRNKKDAIAAVLRIRYKKDPMGCVCCVFHKARAKTCGVLKHPKAKRSFETVGTVRAIFFYLIFLDKCFFQKTQPTPCRPDYIQYIHEIFPSSRRNRKARRQGQRM